VPNDNSEISTLSVQRQGTRETVGSPRAFTSRRRSNYRHLSRVSRLSSITLERYPHRRVSYLIRRWTQASIVGSGIAELSTATLLISLHAIEPPRCGGLWGPGTRPAPQSRGTGTRARARARVHRNRCREIYRFFGGAPDRARRES